MKLALVAAATTLMVFAPVLAAAKSCDELKSEIEEKIKKNGVQTFTLDVIAKAEGAKEADAKKEGAASQGTVVGTCEGGTKEIVYKR